MKKSLNLLGTQEGRFFIYLWLVISSLFLGGCSQLGIGQTEYGCQGMPDGVRCLSASQVYALAESKISLVKEPILPSVQKSKGDSYARIWIANWQDEEGNIYEGHFLNLSR